MANGSWLLPMKAVLLSTGVVSVAVMLKLSLPAILDFLTWELPLLWSLALSWLQPPYLYLLINCIILSIVASSKLQPRVEDSPESLPENFAGGGVKVVVEEKENAPVYAPAEVVFGYVAETAPLTAVETVSEAKEERERDNGGPGGGGGETSNSCERLNSQNHIQILENSSFPSLFEYPSLSPSPYNIGGDGDDEFVVSRSAWTPPKRDTVEYSPAPSVEKPPVSARFCHRRVVRSSPDGKTPLKVSRPKRQETLEFTWRKITEGRPMPLTRHLRKSDPSPIRVMKKSDTFTGGGNSSPASGSGGKLRKESSLSHDELNRRVEAFIKKFNEEMRLQRQESLNQYKEMVNQGSN